MCALMRKQPSLALETTAVTCQRRGPRRSRGDKAPRWRWDWRHWQAPRRGLHRDGDAGRQGAIADAVPHRDGAGDFPYLALEFCAVGPRRQGGDRRNLAIEICRRARAPADVGRLSKGERIRSAVPCEKLHHARLMVVPVDGTQPSFVIGDDPHPAGRGIDGLEENI